MKNQTLFSGCVVVALLVCSFILAPASFAGNTTHTLTIVNNSNTPLKPTNVTHGVVYSSTNSACTAVPPDACGPVNMSPPNTIAANASGKMDMTGPTGCNISAWQSYWTLDLKGNHGMIQCGMSPVNVCNSVDKNFTCTITQSNVDAVKGNGKAKVVATAQ